MPDKFDDNFFFLTSPPRDCSVWRLRRWKKCAACVGRLFDALEIHPRAPRPKNQFVIPFRDFPSSPHTRLAAHQCPRSFEIELNSRFSLFALSLGRRRMVSVRARVCEGPLPSLASPRGHGEQIFKHATATGPAWRVGQPAAFPLSSVSPGSSPEEEAGAFHTLPNTQPS